MSNLEKTIAKTFLEMAEGLETGSFGKKPRIALTGMGSEHGEENAMKAAVMAAAKGVDVVYLSLIHILGLPAADYFIENLLSAYELTLDELRITEE